MHRLRTSRWSRYLAACWILAALLLAGQTSAHVGHSHATHGDSATEDLADGTLILDAVHDHESHATAPCTVCRLGGGIAPAPSLALVPPPSSTSTTAPRVTTVALHESLLLSGSGPRGPPTRV